MHNLSLVRASLVAAALAALVVACNDIKTNVPTNPTAPSVGNLELTGPSSVPPTGSAQFSAAIRLSDGTNKAVGSLRWLTNTFFLRVDTNGIATGQGRTGETTLTAEVTGLPGGTRRASREVVLVPNGTFRLVGTVFDGEFPTAPVQGARVEAAPGLFVNTDANGSYRLYGVPPQADIQITKTGYQPVSQSVDLTGHASRNFTLTPSAPRVMIAGNYTLAIDATGNCSSLSPDLRSRRYDATITQNGLALTVVLTEPRFRVSSGQGDRFFGVAGIGGATFTLRPYSSYYYYYYGPSSYPNVAERLPDNTNLEINGTATTTGTGAGLSGTLNGSFNRWDSRFPSSGFFLGGCFSQSNQFSLTPR